MRLVGDQISNSVGSLPLDPIEDVCPGNYLKISSLQLPSELEHLFTLLSKALSV